MYKIKNTLFWVIIIFIVYGCTIVDFFTIYPLIDYEKLENIYIHNFILYFDKDNIDKEFIEVAILTTDMQYYGHFFFDDIFMEKLENEIFSINADAAIFEKDKKDFNNFNDKLLYFTAIKFIK